MWLAVKTPCVYSTATSFSFSNAELGRQSTSGSLAAEKC